MTLKTDYKDYQFQEGETLRKYQEISNNDGTISFRDVTSYQQEGDRFSASDINSTNAKVNELNQKVGGIETDVSGLQTDVSALQTKSFEGESGTVETKGGYLHDMMIFGKSSQDGTPTPDSPIEIQSVVNPKVTVSGKNLLNPKEYLSTSNNTTLNEDVFTTNFRTGGLFFNSNKKTLSAGNYTVTVIPVSSNFYATLYIYKGNTQEIINAVLMSKKTSYSIKTEVPISICLGGTYTDDGTKYGNFSYKIQFEKGSVATEYEPYKEQSATLPYTLNAIPVSSGGNVTINGQQYIADYVDIENKKLIKYLAKVDVSGTFEQTTGNVNYRTKNQYTDRMIYNDSITNLKSSHFKNGTTAGIGEYCRWVSQNTYHFGVKTDRTLDEINALTDLYIMYPLATPTETTLTDEEVAQFKALKTYEPTTNIIASSDVLNPSVKCDYSLNKETNNIYDRLQENASDVSSITTRLNGLTFVTLTQIEYDALSTKDANTIYFITEG